MEVWFGRSKDDEPPPVDGTLFCCLVTQTHILRTTLPMHSPCRSAVLYCTELLGQLQAADEEHLWMSSPSCATQFVEGPRLEAVKHVKARRLRRRAKPTDNGFFSGDGKKWRMCPLHFSLKETALVDGDQALCGMTERVEDVLLYVACVLPLICCAVGSRILALPRSRPCRKDSRLATSRYPKAKEMQLRMSAEDVLVTPAAQWMHTSQCQQPFSNSLW